MDAVGVIVHGYTLKAKNWEKVVWGEPPYHLGRATKALDVIWRQKACIAVFGGGGSNHGSEYESEFTVNYLLSHWHELTQFSVFRELGHDEVIHRRNPFEQLAHKERMSKNTEEEAQQALELCLRRRPNLKSIYIVSSPDHVNRCHQEALVAYTRMDVPEVDRWRLDIVAVPSHTPYSKEGVAGVRIQECYDPDDMFR